MAPAPPPPAEAPLKGIALRSIAVLCFAIMAAAIKRAAELGVGTVEIVFWRNLFSVPVIVAWVAIGPGWRSLRTRRVRAHALRSGVGLLSMLLNFTAVATLPLADMTAIGFSTPLFATILSAVVLRETVGRHRWIAVALGFAGVLVVVRPFGGALPPGWIALGVAAAAGIACVHVTLRQIGAVEAATTTVFWFNAVSLAVLGLAMPFAATAHPPAAWPWLALVGLAGGTAQIVMTASLRFAPIATLAPFDYVQLLWTTLLGWWLFATTPTASTFAGGIIIAGSGLYIAVRERRRRVTPTPTPTAEVEL